MLAWLIEALRRKAAVSGRDGGAGSPAPAARRLARGLAVFLTLVLATAAMAAPASPILSGGVVDEAGVLPADAIARVEAQLKALEDRTADHFVVATVNSLLGENIDDYARELGSVWGIGQANKIRVVVLLVAPNERKVRIEVGPGLVVSLTDAVCQKIIDETILPRFRANDVAGGVEQGVDAVIKVLSDD